jgi:hypothetical protein
MSPAQRVVALVGAHRVERACQRLRELGLDDAGIQVERLSVPVPGSPRGAATFVPGLAERRGYVLLARAVGAVPGAFAGLAITLGAGLTVVPAILMLTVGAAIGMVAVTGWTHHGRRRAPEPVLELPHVEEHVRLEAHCSPPQLERVERVLLDAGATLIERPAAEPSRPSVEREPLEPRPRQEDTPPNGLELAPS